ncbi:helix-turn-helix transcriptional regulator [Paracoccus sp. (in: a-proteobacteria)]|uniref:helix-turn-helix domain-containing protein n=1 Tax=Paracoccus sp. TaxID=267 RepID=UPI00289D860D|nr:helix-turn-helix transcriptional regulator [Paracoccus sp. (in: a-proteobacteria)]
MSCIVSALEDAASVFYRGRAIISAFADTLGMENDAWRERLAAAVKQSGRSLRSLSMAAGKGPGYVHSLLSEGKSPTIENLMELCKQIGTSPSYILYGVDVQPEDAEIIAAMRDDPETRDAVLALLRRKSAP